MKIVAGLLPNIVPNSTWTFVVFKLFVASIVQIPASFSSNVLMVRFLSLNKKRGLTKVTYPSEGLFHLISGFGIPETFHVMVTGKPAVRFPEGTLGSNVNFGASDRMNEMNVNLDFADSTR